MRRCRRRSNVIQLSARDVQVTSRSSTNTLTNTQLLLVDGRSAYLDFFGLVLWDLLPTNFDDVEQIEVVRARDGNRFTAYTQTYKKKVITAVHNTEHDVEFIYLDRHRVHAPSYSTRIQEVEHPDSPEEREKPEGNDRGIVWRLYDYCSFEERSGDTYMQCESITLSRKFNFFQNLVIRPFIAGLPEELMTFTLGAARRYLTQ